MNEREGNGGRSGRGGGEFGGRRGRGRGRRQEMTTVPWGSIFVVVSAMMSRSFTPSLYPQLNFFSSCLPPSHPFLFLHFAPRCFPAVSTLVLTHFHLFIPIYTRFTLIQISTYLSSSLCSLLSCRATTSISCLQNNRWFYKIYRSLDVCSHSVYLQFFPVSSATLHSHPCVSPLQLYFLLVPYLSNSPA